MVCVDLFPGMVYHGKYFYTMPNSLIKAAHTVIERDVINDAGICEFVAHQGMQWKFIVELAPWM